MIERFWAYPPRGTLRFTLAGGLVVLATPVVALLHVVVPGMNLAMAYLPVVMVVAVLAGAAPALITSVLAFLAYDFLFVVPYFTLTVSDPDEWIALLVFLASAIATGQLASVARARALEATRNERDAMTQFRLVRALAEESMTEGIRAAAGILAEETETPAVSIRLGQTAEVSVGTPSLLALIAAPDALRDAIMLGRPDEGYPAGRWVRTRRQILGRRPPSRPEQFARVRIPTDGEDSWIILGPLHEGLRNPRTQRLLVTAATLIGNAVSRERLGREANEAVVLREAERLRRTMLNAVSHDLRSPLSSIIASAESLLQTDVEWSAEERREFIEAITSEGRRLARMVDHLLDYSRIESGSLHLTPAWVDPGELVMDIVHRLKPILQEHPTTVDLPPQMDAALIDEIAIGEVIANLIENAAAHTPAGTQILVRVRRPAAAFEVVVEDDGPGIPLTSLPSVFEPFMSTKAAGRARTSGLGLAIAHGIVDAHGGTIRAENRRGGGARFTLTLVQRRAPTADTDEIAP